MKQVINQTRTYTKALSTADRYMYVAADIVCALIVNMFYVAGVASVVMFVAGLCLTLGKI